MDSENEELFNNIDKFISETLPNALSQRMAKACIVVENTAKENCPVDDGQLRQSITHSVEQNGSDIDGYVGTDCEYAPYVENGTGLYAKNGDGRKAVPWRYQDVKGEWHRTSGQHPKPFLQDAVDSEQGNLIKQFTELFGDSDE